MNKVELRAERTRLIAEGESMTSEGRAWTPEEETKFADLEAKVNEIDAMVNAEPAADVTASADSARSKLQSWKASAPVTPSVQRSKVYSSAPNYVRDFGDKNDKQKRSLAIRGWLAGGSRSELVNDEIRSAAHDTGMNIDSDRLTLDLFRSAPRNGEELRANLSVGTNSAGGYLVPTEFIASLEKAMLSFGGIREKASIIRTTGGNTLQMPMVNDTSSKASIVGEGSAITAANATFSQFSLGAYKYAASIQASWELIQDSGINLESELGNILGERLARGQSEHLAVGSGSGQPTGLVTGSTLGATQITNDVLSYQDLLNLYHSVDVNYRRNASWVFHDSFLHHQFSTCHGYFSHPFFCRLEDKLHRTFQLILMCRQYFGYTHQDGGVGIVATGMHHARLLSIVGSLHGRLERYIYPLRYRKGIHIGTKGDHGSWLTATKYTDYASDCYIFSDFHA